MPDTITEVAACEACGNEAGSRISIHWHPRLRAALCFLCRDTPPPTWAKNQLQRITITTNRATRPPENTMRSILTILVLVLLCAGCASTRAANAKMDPWLIETGAMPAAGWRAMEKKNVPPLTFTTGRHSTTGGLQILPTRRSTYARADALAYQRLWVKFGGRPPVPFGFDPQADAGVLAIAEAQRAADAR
jgi:hypothetical protein